MSCVETARARFAQPEFVILQSTVCNSTVCAVFRNGGTATQPGTGGPAWAVLDNPIERQADTSNCRHPTSRSIGELIPSKCAASLKASRLPARSVRLPVALQRPHRHRNGQRLHMKQEEERLAASRAKNGREVLGSPTPVMGMRLGAGSIRASILPQSNRVVSIP